MDDLISRQAAIDMCRKPRMRNADCSDFEMEIMMLPSIQPDKDIIHLQKEQAYMQGWEEGRKALREEIWENERDRLD